MNYDDLDYMQKLAFEIGRQTELEKIAGIPKPLAAVGRKVKNLYDTFSGRSLDLAKKDRNKAFLRAGDNPFSKHYDKVNEADRLYNKVKLRTDLSRGLALAGAAGSAGYLAKDRLPWKNRYGH